MNWHAVAAAWRNLDWTAIGALGQWAAATATVAAVWVALRQNRPKVTVTADTWERKGEHPGTIFSITVTNTGILPVKILGLGLMGPRKTIPFTFSIVGNDLLPNDYFSEDRYVEDIQAWGAVRFDIAFAIDSAGRRYYPKLKLFQRIKRRWWWTFGKLRPESAEGPKV